VPSGLGHGHRTSSAIGGVGVDEHAGGARPRLGAFPDSPHLDLTPSRTSPSPLTTLHPAASNASGLPVTRLRAHISPLNRQRSVPEARLAAPTNTQYNRHLVAYTGSRYPRLVRSHSFASPFLRQQRRPSALFGLSPRRRPRNSHDRWCIPVPASLILSSRAQRRGPQQGL
jgi:hypothetical protein